MTAPFATSIERDAQGALWGPWRAPRQMLDAQSYDGHASIHDDDTARKLGFRGGTIEGPTHFSQFDPLAYALWGEAWFATGCISAHYRSPVFEGEEVRASVSPHGADFAQIRMEKRDGTEVLTGTASIGPDAPESALTARMRTLAPLAQPVILKDVQLGMRTGRMPVSMAPDQRMGDLYPFSLADKLRRITEPSPRYADIVPLEMVSVLLNHVAREQPFPTRGPCVGLFADQEIRLIDGPIRVGAPYELDREVVALSGSRKTESMWVRTRLFHPGGDRPIATMLLNTASLKASYASYAADHESLYESAPHA
ncbi:MAG: hypothetical protein VX205_02440 [Pseudomonadota bacterium]|nr:hypothetical protein [Sphingobium naphthae]MEC8033834.1 hypothetical protein [Pseudomonadota bacterium]